MEVSGPMKRRLPSAYEVKLTPSSSIERMRLSRWPRRPLISSATEPWPIGNTRKPAGVRDDRPPPGHELVQPAELRDPLVAGADEEVEGVAEHHVVAELCDL